MPNEPPIDIQFQPSGYLFLASPQNAAALEATVQFQRWGTHMGPSRGWVLGGGGQPDPPAHAGHPQGRRSTGGPAVPHAAEGEIPLDKHGGRGCGVLWYVGGYPHPHAHPSSWLYLWKGRSSPPKGVFWGVTQQCPPTFPCQVWRMKAGSTPGPSSTLSGAKPRTWECRAAPGRCEVRDGGARPGFPPRATPRTPHLTPKLSSFCHLDQLHDVTSTVICTHQMRPRECVCATPSPPGMPVTPLHP